MKKIINMIMSLFGIMMFNLQLFADVQTTLLVGLSAEMKTFYDMTLIDEAAPALVHDQFGQKRPIPKNGGKVIGIQKVLEHYGIRQEEMIAFGDGENDMEMLAWAGTGVAMGNAAPCAKESADWVAPAVDEDGIADNSCSSDKSCRCSTTTRCEPFLSYP